MKIHYLGKGAKALDNLSAILNQIDGRPNLAEIIDQIDMKFGHRRVENNQNGILPYEFVQKTYEKYGI